MKDAMLDIETMGTNPGAVIMSIAALKFDPSVPHQIGANFKMNISLEDSIKLGFRVEASTLKWWLEQRPEILKKQLNNESSVIEVLQALKRWLEYQKIENVWGNSASFDCGLLAAYYRHLKMPVPWTHWNERCYRTLVNLTKEFKRIPKDAVHEAQAHDPLFDCEYQVKNVWKFYEEKLTFQG